MAPKKLLYSPPPPDRGSSTFGDDSGVSTASLLLLAEDPGSPPSPSGPDDGILTTPGTHIINEGSTRMRTHFHREHLCKDVVVQANFMPFLPADQDVVVVVDGVRLQPGRRVVVVGQVAVVRDGTPTFDPGC